MIVSTPPSGGTVQFHDNGTDIGAAATVDTGTGVATLATTALTVGSHTITATYGGTTGFLTSEDLTVVSISEFRSLLHSCGV